MLFGTLKQTAPFLKDDTRLAVWAQEQSCAWYALARTAYAETFY